VYIILCLCSF